jgi:ankyrin repeat protein
MWAAVYGRTDAAKVLLENGADPRLKDDEGKTAADWASRNQREELAKMLREAQKPPVLGSSKKGNTFP